jgi:predicted nucleotide-binding protein
MARAKVPARKPAELSVQEMQAAVVKLQRRISDLENFDVNSIGGRFDPLGEALKEKVNSTLLEIFGTDSIECAKYSIWSIDTLPLVMGSGDEYPVSQVRRAFHEGIQANVVKLRGLVEILEERISDAESLQNAKQKPDPSPKKSASGRRVFVVHGHDEGLKEAVARFLAALDLEPVILHEQPNQGRTIIEKFEGSSDVDFAVVLMTPDDHGYAAGDPASARPRARQNVVLELGFFIAALGRQKVCALHSGDLELPSDFSGILYVPIDRAGAWKLVLAREIKSSGIEIDLNKVM